MATNTYVELDKVTLGTATSTITFSSISGAYTDLIIVGNWGQSLDSESCLFRVGNGSIDSATNYSATELYGSGTAAGSQRTSTANGARITYSTGGGSAVTSNFALHLMNYANTTTYKTFLTRYNVPSSAYPGTGAFACLWRSTAAINTVQLYLTGGNFLAGSTFSLYGIAASGVSPAAKATGGAIYADDTYYYHVFGSTGTFTPLQSLTVDYLVVAGGGAGGDSRGGGGGAGGYRSFASQSLTATGYTVTIGGGGARSSTFGGSGNTSTFNSASSSGGGGGASPDGGGGNGVAGGSGGGAVPFNGTRTGGAGNSGSYSPVEGYAGGNATADSGNYGAGGGGGAGVVGTVGTATGGGVGGNGFTSSLVTTFVNATGIGQLVSSNGYIAGGGGGGTQNNTSVGDGGFGGGGRAGDNSTTAVAGLANTGSGGGGGGRTTNTQGGNGGSGVVIVRYTKV
jgi:hypothetical protein